MFHYLCHWMIFTLLEHYFRCREYSVPNGIMTSWTNVNATLQNSCSKLIEILPSSTAICWHNKHPKLSLSCISLIWFNTIFLIFKCNGHFNLFAFKKCAVPLGRRETVILVQWNSKSVITFTLIFIIQD